MHAQPLSWDLAEHLTQGCGYPSPSHWFVTMSSSVKRPLKTLCGSALSLILCHFFPEEQIPGSCWSKENKGWVELAWTWAVFRSRTSPGSSQVCKKTNVCCCTSLQFWDFCYTASADWVSIGIPTLPQLASLGKCTCRTVASVRANLCAWTCQLRHHDSQNQIHWPFQKTLTWKYPSFELETHKIFIILKNIKWIS